MLSHYYVRVLALWLIYGFFGFIVETLYVSFGQKKFVQRGFLAGPIIPIYAFGALIILYFLEPFHDNVFLVFLIGMSLSSVLEYFGAFIMETLFHIKLWDYSTYKYNLQGRICLKNSILFGILAVMLIEWINPMVTNVLSNINFNTLEYIVIILMLITAVDFIFSVLTVLNIKQYFSAIHLDLPYESFKKEYSMFKNRLSKAYPKMKSVLSGLNYNNQVH